MQLKSLKVFCDVVGWRSFSRAATENGISQSGASQVVNQLERRLGVRLIDRSKRPFVLTPEGETYYDGCRKLVQRYDALEDQVRTLHEEVSGRVRVVSIYSVGLHHMSRYLQKFLSQYPKANVRLEYQHPHRVYEAVEKDHADLGLVSYPRSSRTIEAVGWREEPMVLVCAPGHRLASYATVALEDLAGEKVIGFDSDLTIRREIDRVLQLHNAEVRVAMEFDNIETIKRAIEIDAGVALLPEPTVLREVEAKSLVMVPLSTDELVRPLGIIHRRGKELGSTARRFIELLQSEGQHVMRCGNRRSEQDDSTAELEFGRNGHANGNGHPEVHANRKKNSADPTHYQAERAARVKAK
ncbi:MAG: LysR family transcriptional regulator [Planctomycetia bacterium]|nr:LysR family transcriptional regulator [Planctomycetia bacterium]